MTPNRDVEAPQLSLLASDSTEGPDNVADGVEHQRKGRRQRTSRRPRGTGAVFQKGERWYGQWYVRGKLIKRSLGPVRQPGTREGLTKIQAETRLRDLISETNAAPPPIVERVTVTQAGERHLRQLALKGRKTSTTDNC